jgi:hypothetical protein
MAVLAVAQPGAASAQDQLGGIPPPFLSRVEGRVDLLRAGVSDAASANVPVLPGDRLMVGMGRVAIQWPETGSCWPPMPTRW